MKDSDGPPWLLRIQNAFLPLAKGIYLLVAIGSLTTVIGGSLFALYLQSVISLPVRTVPVPPPYAESPAKTPVPDMDFSLVSNHLERPTNIGFRVTIDTITAPLREEGDVVLGYFLADTSNGLASFPDGITFLGGRDATLFERTIDQEHKETGLKATARLIKDVNEILRDIHEQKERNFEIQVVAQDQYTMLSDLTTISFPLRFGPKSAPPPAPEPPEPTELEKIAGDIAKVVAPDANQYRTDAYRVALEIPEQCKASDQNQVFVANYRQAFEQVRTRLKADNIEAFYEGLCEAWQNVLEREAAARRQVEEAQAAARRQVEEARAQALELNNEASAKHQLEALAAQANTNVTISVVGGALATFLSICVIVAFLAIEGHSRAIREAVKAMVSASEERNRQ